MIGIFVMVLLVNFAFADPYEDFYNDPTADNFAQLSDPTLSDFNRLSLGDQREFLTLQADFNNARTLEFADDYLKKLGSVNSNNDDVTVANKYFSKITGISDINLAKGKISWDGTNLKNGEFVLDVDSVKLNPNIIGIESTATQIVLKFADGSVISTGGSNPDNPFKVGVDENGDNFMLVNGQKYFFSKNSDLEVSISSGNFGVVNKGETIASLILDKDLNPSGPKDVVMIIEQVKLNPGGSFNIRNPVYSGFFPEATITNGEVIYLFQRDMSKIDINKFSQFKNLVQYSDEYHGLRHKIIANGEPVRIEIVNDLGLGRVENTRQATVYLLNPDKWGGEEEINGLTGENLVEAFRERAGFLCVGGGMSCSMVEVDRQGVWEINGHQGIQYSTTGFDGEVNKLYFRSGIDPDAFVTDKTSKYSIGYPESEFFSSEIKSFLVTDKGDIVSRKYVYSFSEREQIVIYWEDRQSLGKANAYIGDFETEITVNPQAEPISGKGTEVIFGTQFIGEDGKLYRKEPAISAQIDTTGENTKVTLNVQLSDGNSLEGDFSVLPGSIVDIDGSFKIVDETGNIILDCTSCRGVIDNNGLTLKIEGIAGDVAFDIPNAKLRLSSEGGLVISPNIEGLVVVKNDKTYPFSIREGEYKIVDNKIEIPTNFITPEGTEISSNIVTVFTDRSAEIKEVKVVIDAPIKEVLRQINERFGPLVFLAGPIVVVGEVGGNIVKGTIGELPVLGPIVKYLINIVDPSHTVIVVYERKK